ncbi:DNA alkylation repair protein, partial [Patescibacteria group bacterium]|nr:DNA alkylation repair protein [Patescibacteria group bacterium]
MKLIEQLKKELKENANREQAKNLKRFFKTGKGEYGEGDIFLGVKVPVQRKISKKYSDLNLSDLQKLLDSKIHEYRFISLVILIEKYKKVVNSTYNFSWKDNKKNWLPGSQQNSNSADGQREIFDFYIKNSKNINNWDLVDVSAPHIVGQYLLKKLLNHKPLVQRENEKNNKNKSILVFCRIPECNILYKLAKSKNL